MKTIKMKTPAKKSAKPSVTKKKAVKAKSITSSKNKKSGVKMKESAKTIKKKSPVKKAKAVVETKGISIPEIIKQAEELNMIPVQSIVHPITIDEAKKLEPQIHIRRDSIMRIENQKAKDAMAKRKGTHTIFQPARRS